MFITLVILLAIRIPYLAVEVEVKLVSLGRFMFLALDISKHFQKSSTRVSVIQKTKLIWDDTLRKVADTDRSQGTHPASDNGMNIEFDLVTLSISGLAGPGLQNGVCLSGCRKSVLKGDLEEHLPSPPT